MSAKTKSVLTRFAKGFISGALSAMGLLTLAMPSAWGEFMTILNALALAGMFGGLNGLLLALNKWASWTE